jgi:hypothetical protein
MTRATLTNCKALGQTLAIGGGAVVIGSALLDSSVLSGNLADAAVGKGSGQASSFAGGLFAGSPTADTKLTHSLVSGNIVQAASGTAQAGGVAAFHLKVKYSTVTANQALGTGDVKNPSAAGGLAVLYSLSMQGSTVDHNQADVGGGMLIGASGGYATIIQSTISSNKGIFAAGGIEAGAPVSLANSTVAFNTAGIYGGGGVLAFGTSATLQGTIIADNLPTDLDGGVAATGSNNLIKILGTNTTAPMDTKVQDPKLLPLAFNGGTTRTHAIAAGSPALDAGNNILALPVDQRGTYYPRLVGVAADIGAFEVDTDHVFGDDFGAE